MTNALDLFKHAMAYQVFGLMSVGAIISLIALPVLNEIVARRKTVTAQSLFQAVGNALKASPLYAVPLVKMLIDGMATPPAPRLAGAMVVPKDPQ